jgi:hypothetical protein
MAAPHVEQNLTPGAIGDPQLPQNPATYHLRKILRCCLIETGRLNEQANIT